MGALASSTHSLNLDKAEPEDRSWSDYRRFEPAGPSFSSHRHVISKGAIPSGADAATPSGGADREEVSEPSSDAEEEDPSSIEEPSSSSDREEGGRRHWR